MLTKQAILAKESDWLQISDDDIKKIGMNVFSIFVSLNGDKLIIIWQSKDRIWEAIRNCSGSLKKLIIETIYNPLYRGELSLNKAQDKIQGNITTCGLDDIDLYKPEPEEKTGTD